MNNGSVRWVGVGLAMVSLVGLAQMSVAATAGVDKMARPFGVTSGGQQVQQYMLTNANGASLRVITYGATITSLCVPDRSGKTSDVVLGFDNLKQYEQQSPYFGCVVGRVANRIAKGRFTVDGVKYAVPVNNGPNHLHGGLQGLDKRVWAAEGFMAADGPSVRFTILDPDGAEGYPGNLKITLIYTLTGGNALKIQYYATTDKATPINLSHHSYFNLKDAGQSDVLEHVLTVNADYYTPVDETLIPTGEIAPVKATPIDFTTPTPIGARIRQMGGNPAGYDHNLVLRNQSGELAKAAEVYEPNSGRVMEVWTTEPGVQFYSGNFLDGSIEGKAGAVYRQYHGLCLETQHYPDSVNQPKFPRTILHPSEVYRQVTEYRFSVRK